MKKQNPNQNNPVVIGALLVVLLGAVVVIFRSFLPQNELTFTPAPSKAADAPAAAAPEAPGALTLERDPFFHSDIQRIAAGEKLIAPESGPADASAGTFPASGPFDDSLTPGASPPANPAGKDKTRPSVKNAGTPAVKGAASPDPAIAENAFAQSLRLTAVLGGSQPRAILESAGSQPTIVHAGDAIGILRVVAIRAQEIVLSGKSGFWTIPLQSAAPSETAAPPTEPTAAGDAKPAEPGSKERNDEAGK